MHCSIKICSISITIVMLSELFRFNSGHPINLVQSVSEKSSHLEKPSIEDSSSIILPDRDLSLLRITNDSSPISEKDILFIKNSNSSSFVIRDIEGRYGNGTDRTSPPSDEVSFLDESMRRRNSYERTANKNKKRKKIPKANFLFRTTPNDPKAKF